MTSDGGNIAMLEAFERHPDGRWTCLKPVTIETPAGTLHVEPGMSFAFGERRDGLDLAEYLEQLGAQFGS